MSMFNGFLSKVAHTKPGKDDKQSDFSKFFRGASSGEKKKVFLDVAKRASEEQREIMRNIQLAQ